MIRDILLGVYGTAWLVVVVITAWRTGTVPAELWAVLGIGVGALLAAFRSEQEFARRRQVRASEEPEAVEDTPS